MCPSLTVPIAIPAAFSPSIPNPSRIYTNPLSYPCKISLLQLSIFSEKKLIIKLSSEIAISKVKRKSEDTGHGGRCLPEDLFISGEDDVFIESFSLGHDAELSLEPYDVCKRVNLSGRVHFSLVL